MKKRMVSGITATGRLTLGNYLGVIKELANLQNKYDLFIFVADLHALTIDLSPSQLARNRRDVFALLIACGIDPQKTVLFFQSDVSDHSQLSWIMESFATTGELMRMNQFKEKSKQSREPNRTFKSKTTLLTYPALMAADILLYNPDQVPVGADQKQHIELARNIANRFNNRYGHTFVVPEFVTPKVGSKIMALQEPTKKMAKSDVNSKNSIYLLDDIEVAMRKIKSAVTDSEGQIYISDNKPGIKNLLTIYAGLSNKTLEEAKKKFQNQNYGALKIAINERLQPLLIAIQSKYRVVKTEVSKYAIIGATKARPIARTNLERIHKKIGLGQ